MCLINFQYRQHPHYKLVVAANRDEFYGRPALQAHFWEDHPEILAGRDLSQMGTWLGVTKSGRFAALTNFRDPSLPETGKISRGALVRDYLASDSNPENFLKALEPDAYTGFNVLLGDTEKLFYYNNLQQEIVDVSPGIHGLSNHFLNTPWPKVVKGKSRLESYLDNTPEADPDDLFELLLDAEQAADPHLPVTGVGLEFERILSPIFIKTPDYGTRSATVLLVDYENNITFAERTYEKGEFSLQNIFRF
ncbi:NRDE family protein [Planococcus sp. CAU13]|uniref:NRDE family protein n=1 Tax=Planococcus sp. CAU13 TaxID=1541197 RepID=UPI00052FE1CC|nr:NRDE family protein [Planococcus sp. CAU13]